MICASTVLALHIEVALEPAANRTQRLMAWAHIHAGLSYLRNIGENWPSIKWTLRVFEWIVARAGLSVADDLVEGFRTTAINPSNNHDSSTSNNISNNNNNNDEVELPFETAGNRSHEMFEGLPNDWIRAVSEASMTTSQT